MTALRPRAAGGILAASLPFASVGKQEAISIVLKISSPSRVSLVRVREEAQQHRTCLTIEKGMM